MQEDIHLLTDSQHARLRTAMWLGSKDPHTQTILEYDEAGKPFAVETVWVPAIFTAIREILDNAIDEVIAHGHGDRIDVSYDSKTMTFVVQDNGRGIPIEFDKTHQQYKATLAMTETKAGRNFVDDRGATRGMNGVGGSIVNFCSEWFTMDIYRDKKHFSQRFHEGDGSRTANLVIEDPFIIPVPAQKAKVTGTRIEFKLSPKVFHDLRLPDSFLKSRMVEVALCYPQLKLYYNGKLIRQIKGGVEKTLFPDDKPISIEINQPGFSSHFWMIPDFFKEEGNGEFIAEFNHSVVNAIPMFNGGIHIDTFRKGFFGGMLAALERESKKRKLKPNRSDLCDGMLLYNITQMDAPTFDGQAKTRLIDESVGAIIRKALNDPEFFKTVIKKNPEWVDRIYEKCAERTQKKDDDEAKKLAKQNARSKVEALRDACGNDRSKCILMLTEGDSALGGINEARNADIHGVLPLRGKVLNVYGETNKTVWDNDALKKIMMSIGLVPGQRVNRHMLRYGKVYLTMDADEDGKNIVALLVNFFYTFWPELFDPQKEPFVYNFETPLIIAAKAKQRKYWYADNYEEFDSNSYKNWDITRAKGLAALQDDDWIWILNNIKATPVTDDGKLKDTLELLFNPKLADARKEWIAL